MAVYGADKSQATIAGACFASWFKLATGTAAYSDSDAQLGRQRFVGLSYPAPLRDAVVVEHQPDIERIFSLAGRIAMQNAEEDD